MRLNDAKILRYAFHRQGLSENTSQEALLALVYDNIFSTKKRIFVA